MKGINGDNLTCIAGVPLIPFCNTSDASTSGMCRLQQLSRQLQQHQVAGQRGLQLLEKLLRQRQLSTAARIQEMEAQDSIRDGPEPQALESSVICLGNAIKLMEGVICMLSAMPLP